MLSNKISKLIIRKVALFSITFLVVLSAISLASFTNILSGENTPTQSGALSVSRGQKVHTFVNMRKSDGRSLETPGDLSISGNIQIKGGSPSAGKFLKAIDTDGNTIWTNISAIQGAQGATGVGIAQTNIINGQLIITLTDGTVITGSSIIGPKGNTGAAGIPGTGALGATGATGVGIARTNIVNGQLIITLTNGTVITGTSIIGPQGPAGATGASVTGALGATGVGIARTNIVNGQLIITLTNGTVITGSSIIGPKGNTGALGATGTRGATGFLDGGILGATAYYNGSKWITGSTNIYNNGTNIGIGNWATSIPEAGLHVKLSNVLFGNSLNGAGIKFIWNTAKAALRVGTINSNGRDNANVGSNSIAFGEDTKVTSDHSSILGGLSNEINNIYGSFSFIGGGAFNINEGLSSFIGGGQYNNVNGTDTISTTIAGGDNNNTHGSYGFIGGGQHNNLTGENSVIVGGSNNTGGNSYTSIVGGQGNQAYGENSVIVGGFENITYATEGSIVGGQSNKVESRGSTIVGGKTNWIRYVTSSQSFIGGGNGNTIAAGEGAGESDQASVIVGGKDNKTNGKGGFHFIGGGRGNEIVVATLQSVPPLPMNNEYSLIVGGRSNKVRLPYSSIVGGFSNEIDGYNNTIGHSFIGGGFLNKIYGGLLSYIGGGSGNQIAGGMYNTIGGGYNNKVSLATISNATIPGGQNANVTHSNSFTWNGDINTTLNSIAVGAVTMRAIGGFFFFTNTGNSKGIYLNPNGGSDSWIKTTNNLEINSSELSVKGGDLRIATTSKNIYLDGVTTYNGLGKISNFGGLSVDGVAFRGAAGGILGTRYAGTDNGILAWNNDGIGIKTSPIVGKALAVNGNVLVTGNASISSNLTVGNDLTVNNTLTLNGLLKVRGIYTGSVATALCSNSTPGNELAVIYNLNQGTLCVCGRYPYTSNTALRWNTMNGAQCIFANG